jgi:hypothetical protein
MEHSETNTSSVTKNNASLTEDQDHRRAGLYELAQVANMMLLSTGIT